MFIDDLGELAPNKHKCDFCSACFNGDYPTMIPTSDKNRFEQKISENPEKAQKSYKN